jgi:hypothetical protein
MKNHSERVLLDLADEAEENTGYILDENQKGPGTNGYRGC